MKPATTAFPMASRPAVALAVSLVALLAATTPARAQSLDEMKAQITLLQRRIEQLEAAQRRAPAPARATPPAEARQAVIDARQAAAQAQQAAAQAQQQAVQARQQAADAKTAAVEEVKAAYAPAPGTPAGSFRIPGSNVTVRIYGMVKLNASWDMTGQDRSDNLTAQSIQLGGSANRRTGGDMQMSARRSRLGFETWVPINETFGEFHTQVEMDFAGQNTSLTTQATSNSYTPRLRKAYAEFGNKTGGWGTMLFGQTDSLFNDSALLPIQWLADWDFVGTGNVRQAQLRYIYGFAGGISAAFAVESPYSDITTSAGTSYPDNNGGGGLGWQTSPDFSGRLMWQPDWGMLALRGVVRPQVGLNNQGATASGERFNKSVAGYGIGVTAMVSLLDGRLALMASGNGGTGLGRYLTSTANGFAAVSDAGLPGVAGANTNLDPVDVYGGMIGAQFFFTPTLRTNAAIGGAHLSFPRYTAQFGGCVAAPSTTGSCAGVNSAEWAGSINLIWSPFKAVDIGVEYQHVERTLASPLSLGSGGQTKGGVANRVQVTLIGRF